AKMPAVFRAPSDDPTSTNAGYFVLRGPPTMFPGEEQIDITAVRDGTSKTIAIVDAKSSTPWAKPVDIEYHADKALPKIRKDNTDGFTVEIGGWLPGGFLAGFADGHVEFISNQVDEQTLRWMIEKADGNRVAPVPTVERPP